MRKEKLSPRGPEIDFEDGLIEEVTARAGVSLLVETTSRSGVMDKGPRVHPRSARQDAVPGCIQLVGAVREPPLQVFIVDAICVDTSLRSIVLF